MGAWVIDKVILKSETIPCISQTQRIIGGNKLVPNKIKTKKIKTTAPVAHNHLHQREASKLHPPSQNWCQNELEPASPEHVGHMLCICEFIK